MTDHDSALTRWCVDQLEGVAPAGLQRLLDRVLTVIDSKDWVPPPSVNVWDILSLGAVLARVDHPSFRSILASISPSIVRSGWPEIDTWAELSTAALLRPWFDEVMAIPPSDHRTPDLRGVVGTSSIEIEVVHGHQKEEQRLRGRAAATVHGRLARLALQTKEFVLFFLDTLSDREVELILQRASELPLGGAAGVHERWQLRVSSPNPQGTSAIETTPPSWWPRQYAQPVQFGGFFQIAQGRVERSPVQVQWGLSTRAYINPLQRKADRPQASASGISLLALDATELPGALGWYKDNLPGHLSLWDHVSGVLVFNTGILVPDGYQWKYQFFANPISPHPLPAHLLQYLGLGRDLAQFFDFAPP
jgi:hypothetical protein